MKRGFILLAVNLFSFFCMRANIRLPQLVGDHMVLQRDRNIKIWGWAAPAEKISIRFNGKEEHTVTGTNGGWMIELPAMKAGGPFSMTITGENKIVINDILIGDVWFCSGQSNMVLPMERIKEKYPEETAHDSFPEIRNFFVPTAIDVIKVHEDLPQAKWTKATGADLLAFGGLSYFFAKQLYVKHHVPIGIINSSVGGYPIEAWMSADACTAFPILETDLRNLRDSNSSFNLARKNAVKASNNPVPITESDKGMMGSVRWTDPAYIPEHWHPFWLPGYWADQGVKGLHGILYFRKEIDIPVSMTGIPAKLFLGRIVDADSTFVNGQFVGNITYQYPPRRYSLPSGLLKPGKNIIVIKVVNSAGKGGFVPDKNYSLVANGQKIDLRGDWTYQVGQVLGISRSRTS